MDVAELLDNARRNEALLRRLQTFELQLLSCQRWFDLLTLLLEGLPEQFDLEAIGLKICDPDGSLKQAILQSLDLDQAVLVNQIEFHSRVPMVPVTTISPPPPWQSGLALPLLRNDVYLGQLRLYSSHSGRFLTGMATDFMQHLAAVIAACFVMVKQTEEQARLALTDPLTGVDNRRGFERAYEREWARGQRQYHVFSIILIDIDHFKQINDVHGHATGDRALQALCRTFKQVMRPTDQVGRLGGEEFVLLLPGCQPEQLMQVVERVRTAIAECPIVNDQEQALAMTASGSFLSITPRPNQYLPLSQVLEFLDVYLYRAKHAGRNRFLGVESETA